MDTYMEGMEHDTAPRAKRTTFYAFVAGHRHISLNRCRDRSRSKRSAFICELRVEMEQCIPAPERQLFIFPPTPAPPCAYMDDLDVRDGQSMSLPLAN